MEGLWSLIQKNRGWAYHSRAEVKVSRWCRRPEHDTFLNTPLQPEDYFELKVNVNQEMHTKAIPGLLFSDEKKKHLKNEECCESPLSREVLWLWKRLKVSTQMDLHKKYPTPLVSPIYYLLTVCHTWKPKTLFLCLVTSLQMYCSLVKMLYKPKF